MTTRAAFKQSDVTRAIAGVKAAGEKVDYVEVVGGRIVVHIAEGPANSNRRLLDRIHAA